MNLTPDDVKALVPLVAAFATLLGVVVTLVVTDRRSVRQSRITRQDAYRAEMRTAIGQLLINLQEFIRHGRALSYPEDWVEIGPEKSSKLADEAETTLRSVNTSLVNAQLLAQEQRLLNELDTIDRVLDRACAVMHDVLDGFWESRPPALAREREERWEQLVETTDRFRKHARLMLRPTVFQEE